MSNTDDIYEPEYVAALFDRCSASYRRWSAVASFGMVRLWRKVCVKAIPKSTDPMGLFVDLMAGTGEVWPHLLRRYPNVSEIRAIDISTRMHQEAMKELHESRADRVTHTQANVLTFDLVENTADCVVCTFGLKTFDKEQQIIIARQVNRLLKPGGTFSFIEASDPTQWIAQDFSMIGTYTKHFENCDHFAKALAAQGLQVESYSHFFGCATGVRGIKKA